METLLYASHGERLNVKRTANRTMNFKLDGPAVSALRRAIAEVKQTLVSHWMGDQKFIISSSTVLRKAR
jgi:hypothetical protein